MRGWTLAAMLVTIVSLPLYTQARMPEDRIVAEPTQVNRQARHQMRRAVHHRRVSRRQLRRDHQVVGAGVVRARTGATAQVNPAHQRSFQCLVDRLESQGYRIDFMGGYRRTLIAGTRIRSRHWTGDAMDVNQTGRNRVTRHLPVNSSEIARSCGLFHGAEWARGPDGGHFEVLSGRIAQWPRTLVAIPVPRPRPTIVDTGLLVTDVDRIDSDAMLVSIPSDEARYLPPDAQPPSRNIFEAFADSMLRPVGNCKGWERIAPGVKRIVSDATRHFSRKYQRVMIAEANSCYRDSQHNRRVRGARNSAHLRFMALDFQITTPDHSFRIKAAELFAFCRGHVLSKGCGIYNYESIIHADVDRVLGRRSWDWRGGKKTRLAKKRHRKRHA